ncbi:MAG: tetratricopeptide repeat protein [Flavobacteriaceae bacterium]|nr:tetratricopeptide repeat protein [Flavobacteriaceae bacterium]
MKTYFSLAVFFFTLLGYAQEKKDLDLQESNDLVYQGNELITDNEFVSAEMEYRKAISKKPDNAVASYDLGNAYYENERFDEALLRHTEAVEFAETKEQKHRAWHNIGNTLMKGEKCQEAVESYKNALRNDPTDDETRYNLGLAKECAKKQQQEEEDKKNDDEKKDEDKDKEEKDGEDEDEKDDGKQEENEEKENEDQQNQDQGEDEKDENGNPKDDKQEQDKEGKPEDDKQQPQQKPGQLSPQQIKNLLEAMNNQEQKVQEKINAQKTKGVKVKTDKDW